MKTCAKMECHELNCHCSSTVSLNIV